MTLSAWRPMVDAPAEGTILVKLADGRLLLALAAVVHVGRDDCDGSGGWQEAAWVDEEGQVIPEESMVSWCALARTYELDRAVQGEIARAFGALLSGLQASSFREQLVAFAPPKQAWVKRRLREANKCRQRGLLAFRRILHTSMGGRIPDEVP